MLNLITDIGGILVGHASDATLISGTTALIFSQPATASVAVLGGAPAGRDLGCLEPDAVVERVDAIVLSGGSGFGLDAGSGVQSWLRERGRGFAVGPAIVPIVPAAVCFDLTNGGNKDWGRFSPYRELGYAAAEAAASGAFLLGTAGAGYGASTVDLKGGLGSASAKTSNGHTVGAIVAVNALGSGLIGQGPHFWASPLEQGQEFGGLGYPAGATPGGSGLDWKGRRIASTPPSTTIACVATDARLDKAQLKRVAVAANAGLSRGLRVSHAAMDGDTVFAVSTSERETDGLQDLVEIGAVAADCLSRAIARGLYEATTPPPAPNSQAAWAGPPSWRERFA